MSYLTQLYNDLCPIIAALPSGYEFRIRELLPNPQPWVGRMVVENHVALGIEKIPNNIDNVNLWRKI